MTYIALDYFDVALAALLLIVNAGLSLKLHLGLERPMLVAALRMTVQLILIGLVLKALFAAVSPWLTGLAVIVMLGFAGHEVTARQTRRLSGWWTWGLGTGAMATAGLIVTFLALTTQVRPDPWYDPRYALPLLGMILGNTMNGVSLGLDRLLTTVVRERPAIEARLALGHSFSQALEEPRREAFRAGMMNMVNAMSAAGVVSLPGMMTGQILAGADPVEAVKYQLLIMFLISGGVGLGVLVAISFATHRLTDPRQRLRLDRLSPETGRGQTGRKGR